MNEKETDRTDDFVGDGGVRPSTDRYGRSLVKGEDGNWRW